MFALRIAAAAAGLTYLTWRLAFTWQGADPILFFLLVGAEAFGMVRLWSEISLLGARRPAEPPAETGMAPDADVVVVVTDEPASEVRAAILSARVIRGYGAIAIVDRDARPDVAALATRLDILRVVGGPDADLGALVDEALAGLHSLYTLLVPADVVVMPDILEVTAPAFDDHEVAVVACRIDHANAAVERDHGGYGEDLRRDALMIDRLDRAGALPWWPGMAVVRRSAVAEAGGMAPGRHRITLATGVRLQAEGWRIVDVPVVVARRLASWNDDRHLHRRARDLHERIRLLVDKDVPRRDPDVPSLSRRVYRSADIVVGRAIQRLVLIGILFATLFTSSLPLVADARILVALWGAWALSAAALQRVATSALPFTPRMVTDLRLLATDLAVAVRALPGRELDIELVDRAPGRRARSLLLGVLEVGLPVTVLAFGAGVLRPSQDDFVTIACLLWCVWLWVMVHQARAVRTPTQLRQGYRARGRLDVFASEIPLEVVGISPLGVDVVTDEELSSGRRVRLAFGLPRPDGSTVRLDCVTTVRRSMALETGHLSYLRFAHLDDRVGDVIAEYCAIVAGHRELRDRPLSLPGPRVGARAAKGNGL